MKCSGRCGAKGYPARTHVLAACVACSHVHFGPVSHRFRCLVSRQRHPLFSNRRQGNKSFAHTVDTHTHTPIGPLSRCHGQQINDHKAIFSAAQGAMGAMVEIYERDCRPKNYSVHKLLNAKSFDFNYAENFYCQTCGCGCRTRTFPAFPASWQIHRSFSLCSPSPAS